MKMKCKQLSILNLKKNVKCYVSVTLIKSIFVDLQYDIHMVYCTAKTMPTKKTELQLAEMCSNVTVFYLHYQF